MVVKIDKEETQENYIKKRINNSVKFLSQETKETTRPVERPTGKKTQFMSGTTVEK